MSDPGGRRQTQSGVAVESALPALRQSIAERVDGLANGFSTTRRTIVAGIALPLVAVVVVAATLIVAPPAEQSTIVLASLVAVAAGLATASAGVYGGVMVPGLLLLGIDPRFAAAVTLFLQPVVVPIAAGSHYRMGNFSRSLVKPLLIGGVLGGFVGPLLAVGLATEVIARFVAVLIVVVGLVVLLTHRLRLLGHARTVHDVPTRRVAGIGIAAGLSSGISGAGWGPLGVTMLILSRIDPKQAVGSSLFVRSFMAGAAVIGYIVAQTAFHNVVPNWWIVVPLFVGSIAPMIPAAMLVSRLGRERATIVITLLSIMLALPTLIWGH